MSIQSIKDSIQEYIDDGLSEKEMLLGLNSLQTHIFTLLQNIEENSSESSYEDSYECEY